LIEAGGCGPLATRTRGQGDIRRVRTWQSESLAERGTKGQRHRGAKGTFEIRISKSETNGAERPTAAFSRTNPGVYPPVQAKIENPKSKITTLAGGSSG
jgi:hypothetical protein